MSPRVVVVLGRDQFPHILPGFHTKRGQDRLSRKARGYSLRNMKLMLASLNQSLQKLEAFQTALLGQSCIHRGTVVMDRGLKSQEGLPS